MSWVYEKDYDINPITKKITFLYQKFILEPTGKFQLVINSDCDGVPYEQDEVEIHDRKNVKRISKEEYEENQ